MYFLLLFDLLWQTKEKSLGTVGFKKFSYKEKSLVKEHDLAFLKNKYLKIPLTFMNRNCKYSSQSAWARGSHFICRGLSISMGFLRCSCFLSVENAGIPPSPSACPAVSTRGRVANGLQDKWSGGNGDARGPGTGPGPARSARR